MLDKKTIDFINTLYTFFKSSEKEDLGEEKSEDPMNYIIVRTYSAGVFAGELVYRKDKEVKLKNARRLWSWEGAASLSQLAVDGVSKPLECKFPCEVPEVIVTEAIEILKVTKKAEKSIKEVPVWQY